MKLLPAIFSHAKNLHVDDGANLFSSAQLEGVDRRDGHCCRFCGWREEDSSVRHYVSLKGIYGHEQPENTIVTCCQICVLTLRLTYTSRTGAGRLIYLPEWNQQQLSFITRSMYVINRCEGADDVKKSIECLNDYLEERILEAPRYLRSTGYSLQGFVEAFTEMSPELYAKRQSIFSKLRVIPEEGFLDSAIGSKWDGLISNFPESSWDRLVEQIKE